ncbi:MAG: phosphate ABC transporter, permease protein PstA [Planctomycetaceae bacterium TMED10]|nr:MAG: phosphate ABC transporter, permease protein PstA [Planctomycetaceae bacterium TMED10]
MSLQATQRRHTWSKFLSGTFACMCLLATLSCIAALVLLLWQVFSHGMDWLTWDFIRALPSRFPAKAGIRTALAGSLWLMGLTTIISVPIGVGAAIYLEEYATANRLRTLVQTNIANLAGVPSIVYGILGLGLFVRFMALERSILAGALTLSLVVLPIIVLASQEALRAVPPSIRNASFALGATKWQTIWHQVLPASVPGIMTGVILAMARALGEAAPLLAIGAVAYVPFVPSNLSDEFTALPIQIFNWSARPQEDFHSVAAAGIIVLLAVLICLNAIAVFVRYRASKRIRW